MKSIKDIIANQYILGRFRSLDNQLDMHEDLMYQMAEKIGEHTRILEDNGLKEKE